VPVKVFLLLESECEDIFPFPNFPGDIKGEQVTGSYINLSPPRVGTLSGVTPFCVSQAVLWGTIWRAIKGVEEQHILEERESFYPPESVWDTPGEVRSENTRLFITREKLGG